MSKKMSINICQRCIYNETIPNITFNNLGICNYCEEHDKFNMQFPQGTEGERKLHKIFDTIKRKQRSKKYDAIIGVSGGCDSSFLLHTLTTKYNLRLLAVHFDNTWNSQTATKNIYKLTKKLKIDLYTYVVDSEEFDDLILAFLKAGVKDIEIPTDLALAATMNLAAEKYRIKYKIDGHSFRTEGSAPLGWNYIDAKYLESIHKIYGTIKLKTFPNLWLSKQIKWMLFNGFKSIRPLYYMNYNKEEAKKILHQLYDWNWYGGHHLENRTSAFFHSYFLPNRWGIDSRIIGYAAQCRNEELTRNEAFKLMESPPLLEEGLIEHYKKRLNLDDTEFTSLMECNKRYYSEFKNYKSIFRKYRLFFYIMARLNRIPWSFYYKYTK